MSGIDDSSIDLTVDEKFKSTSLNTSIREVRGGLIRARKVTPLTNLETIRPKRRYGDYVSDVFGDTVRRTSDGHVTFFGDNSVVPDEVMMESYFAEELGYMPDNTNYICPMCGKVYPTRNIHYEPCDCEGNFHGGKYRNCRDKLFPDKSFENLIPPRFVPWVDGNTTRTSMNFLASGGRTFVFGI